MHRVEHVMGTAVSVESVADPDPLFAWLRWVDAAFSPYRADSEVSRLDRGELAEPHPLVREVLARCEELRAETGGAFDARATGRLDPSGFVKGWAVQRGAGLLEGELCVNAGGDVLVRGRRRVGIRHPRAPDRVAAVIEAEDLAVATTGAYERGPHLIDPHTGGPPAGVLSVTITGPDLGLADAYATAAFAMGRAGPRWTAGLRGYEAMTILDDDTVLTTPGFDRLANEGPAGVR